MEEELAQRFYEKLVNKEGNPGVILTQFYCSFYGFEFNTGLISQFGKLVKIYGRNLAYMTLLDLFDIDNLDHSKIFNLINYLAKRRFEEKHLVTETEDLSTRFEELAKEIRKTKRAKIDLTKDPFNAE